MTAERLAIQLILMVGIGLLAVKIRILGESFEKQMTSLVMKIILPCMIVKSMMGGGPWEELKHCGALALIAIALWEVTFGLAQLVYCLMGKIPLARIMRLV